MNYEVHQIRDRFWRIEQQGVRCFLLEGDDHALLIDSGFGGDLRAEVEKLTDKPIKLLHTHCDRDHIGASEQFDELYMHPSEYFCSLQKNGKPLPWCPVWEGNVWEVGLYRLEVILIPGHTPGSIALLDRRHRFLISGDSIQTGAIYMFGVGRDLSAFEASMEKMLALKDAFDVVYPSHSEPEVDPAVIAELRDFAAELNRGLRPEGFPAPAHLPATVRMYRRGNARMFLEMGE